MRPHWINDQLTVSAFIDGAWERSPLSATLDEPDSCRGMTSDGAAYRIRFMNSEPLAGARSMWTVEIEAAAGPSLHLSGIQAEFPVDCAMSCIWKPHLCPEEGMTIGDKVFRSPCIVMENESTIAALIPDLNHLAENRTIPHVMDYIKDRHSLVYGCSDYTATGHVYYELTPSPRTFSADNGKLVLRFYLMEWVKAPDTSRDLRPAEQALWELYGKPNMRGGGVPSLPDLTPYAMHTYAWAFDRWKDLCWQQFTLNGTEVGGVVFIVKAKQKPGCGQEHIWREPKSLWNQAWFCSLRSAYGYYVWGRSLGRKDWMDKALLSLEFALQAPQTNGLFPGYFRAGEDQSWDSGEWVMSPPRRPQGHEAYIHLLDSSWTCLWLLKWYRDLRRDSRILRFAETYIQRLLTLQTKNGSFPAWIHPDTSEVSPYLQVSPESSVHMLLLCLWNQISPNAEAVKAAEKTADFIGSHILPQGRWEDFETYWSCSKQWDGKQYGKPDPRSGLYNQCTFGMYWTAEGFKELYCATSNRHYLEQGERVLAELSLYQQIWQPPYIPVPTVGGFGVMNCDDEWNDARQSLLALTYLDYHRLTGNPSYEARGLWAMKASFYMMYCPENPVVKRMYEKAHPHFNETDYGFHMENFNHSDRTAVEGIGEFTIFDWGNGAAASTLGEMLYVRTQNGWGNE